MVTPTDSSSSSSSSSSPQTDADRDAEATRVNLYLHAENTRIFTPPTERRLPVTVVTGFLGSGKTTLLRHVLTNRSNLRIAAAINDFAELNIDTDLVKSASSGGGRGGENGPRRRMSGRGGAPPAKVVELTNGCVCCTLLSDLKDAVWSMLSAGGDVDTDNVNYLVVETSGITDPQAIVRTLDAQFGKTYRARLDCVVTVVDSDSVAHVPPGPALISQLRRADVVLMNKIDLLADGAERDLVEARVRSYNPDAALYPTTRCDVPLSCILDVVPADLGGVGGGGENRASGASTAVVPITHERTGVPLYVSATGGALRCSASNVGDDRESGGGGGSSQRGGHVRLDRYASVSATVADGPLSLARLQRFVTSKSVRALARMKGVLWIRGLDDYRCVLHLSGRGRLGFELDGCWAGPPGSDMAFIGTDLDEKELGDAFARCRYDLEEEQTGENRIDLLRACPEFHVYEDDEEDQEADGCGKLAYFHLTGSQVYGYTEDEIERDLRIDTDGMNLDLADAVNASVACGEGDPKAFLAYTKVVDADGRCRVMLCYPGHDDPANNMGVLVREAKNVLARHFRNVTVCKCGN